METNKENFSIPKVWAERSFWAAIVVAVAGYFNFTVTDNSAPAPLQPEAVVVDENGKTVPGVSFEQFSQMYAQFAAERVYVRAQLADQSAHIAAIERKLSLPTIQPGSAPPVGAIKSIAPADTETE